KYITWPLITALVAGPILVLLLPRWLRFLPNIEFTRVRRLMATATAILLIAIYGLASQSYMHAHWTDPGRWERRIAQSPHAVLLASCVDELLQAEPFTASFLTHNMDDRDFRRRGSVQTILPESARANRPRNVVVFFLESSGAEYLSLHGSRHDTTPNLKRLAAEKGVMFEDLYVSVPNSCKSLVALTSSVYPRPDWKLIVQDCPRFSVPSIQQVLVNEGYRTCFAHSGFWSWRNRDNYLRQRGAQTLIDADTLHAKRINSWGVSDQAMFDACLEWIDADRQTPFFLLAYTIETHHPSARPEHPIEFDVADPELNDYLNALRATDERIAHFLRQLAERGLEESTLVVVTTDHGESFGQHNQREHMFGVYQPNVHIPLVMLHPSLQDLPRRIKGTREQIDIAPTILDLLGYAAPSDWQGRNLFRRGEDRPGYFFCVGNHVVLGLRDKQWKY
ncbi:MAG: LTA synthase family protein, partial [Thermomicrobiales bacterium]|nr:LTA synthase family protein [Thermomicrobiales bacterium]